MTTKPELQLSQESIMALSRLLKKHEELQHTYRHGDVVERIEQVVNAYHNLSLDTMSEAKTYRDRLLVDFRAISMVLMMVSNASTHREKESRLRGCGELIETAIRELEKISFDVAICNTPHWRSLFYNDYPTRHLIERIHELEGQVKSLTTVPLPDIAPPPIVPADLNLLVAKAKEEIPW